MVVTTQIKKKRFIFVVVPWKKLKRLGIAKRFIRSDSNGEVFEKKNNNKKYMYQKNDKKIKNNDINSN